MQVVQLNPQGGRLLYSTVTTLRPGPAPANAACDTTAERYDLSGDVHMQIWCTRTHRWVGLTFSAHDGSLVRYERP